MRTREQHGEEEGFTTPAWLVALGFTAVILAATVLFLGVLMALLIPSTAPARGLSKAAAWLLDTRPALWGIVATVALAAAVGVALFPVPRHRSASLFLLAVGAWCVPRALTLG